GDSIGKPWRGRLRGGVRLPPGKGYFIRRPLRSWGTPETVAAVTDVLRSFRATHPELHTLAIGDLSQHGGGRITEHRSHQSGRDVDIGLCYTKVPAGYPEHFAVATADNLDRAATWDLLTSFAKRADDPDGVEVIFLDFHLQGLLYEWAKAKGVDERYLDRLFQYPEPGGTGLVRHVAHHDDHMHVRFRCPAGDDC
ncbi:MAG TPA: penicillin-insensitive murein endopeptidase, partial [Kofleriaceae bacterium]|nr:penicillin-insensitive murein endopeptidase [Kofleriaceae bacterium]